MGRLTEFYWYQVKKKLMDRLIKVLLFSEGNCIKLNGKNIFLIEL